MLERLALGTKFSDRFAVEWTSEANPASRWRRLGPVLAAVLALSLWACVYGFTVDDALISARYAHHLATGSGYVFNRGGEPSDGVTPLGYAHLLALFAGESTLAAFAAAKLLGLLAMTAAFGLITSLVWRLPGSNLRFAPLALWLLSPQTAAWASSGMETGLVSLLVALGLWLKFGARTSGVDREPISPALVLGMAAAWRPELMPCVLLLAMPRALDRRADEEEQAEFPRSDDAARQLLHASGRALVAMLPFVSVSFVRAYFFATITPLSVVAKRPDLSRGFAYAGASLVLIGAVQLLSLWTVKRGSRLARWLSLAVFAHAVAVTLAGGDWMALSRLFVPALPAMVVVAALVAAEAPRLGVLVRSALALAAALFAWNAVGWNVGRVGADRMALIDAAAPVLSSSQTIAAVDVGWLGAAAPHATIVDLAGVTDPEVARLPGAHTTKKIPDGFLVARRVDTLVFNLEPGTAVSPDWATSPFLHGVERYVALEPGVAQEFEPVFHYERRPAYLVLRRKRSLPR